MDNQVIQMLKQRLNIVDIVRRYVPLRQASGRHMGLCPFHQEKTASFSVNEAEGFYYCFGCQAAGDVLDFYMKINGVEFKEALEQLAAEAGIELKTFRPDPEHDEKQQLKRQCLDMHAEAQAYYRRNLGQVTGDAARTYIRRRGTSPEIVTAFGLGASPDDWHGLMNHLGAKGYSPEQGVVAGLLSKNEKGNIYDRFRGRLIFPIQNLSGQVIAFGGRIITEGEPKYLNSSDTPIYKKGEHLYGLHQARQAMTRSKRAILTEGYMDVLSLAQFGYADSCGVLGTSLTVDQVKRLAGFCSRIELIFDGDTAGRKAALRSAEMILHQGVACRVLLMPDGEDVDSLLHKQGRDGLEKFFEQAPDGLDYCLDTVRTGFAPREIVAWATGFLGLLSDNALRAYYLPRLADGLGLSEADLRRFGGARAAVSAQPVTARPVQPLRRISVGRDERDDRAHLVFPVLYPEYVSALEKQGFASLLATEWGRGFWDKLTRLDGQALLAVLEDQEKAYFVKTRSTALRLEGEDLAQEWEHVCSCIRDAAQRQVHENLKAQIRAADERGDAGESMRLMAELNRIIAPSREEE